MSRLVQPVGPSDHALGAPTAHVELVEYGDYECPFCRRAQASVHDVVGRFRRELRYVFRHFPLSQVHPHALVAAQAAEAAGAQRKFWPMHEMLFEHQSALEEDDLASYAETIGLDVSRFLGEVRTGVHMPKVRSDFRSGVRSGANGTPTFFVDGARHDGGWDADALSGAIEHALRREQYVP